MIEQLSCTCENDCCANELGEEEWMLTYRTGDGERRLYECSCGAVTITVHR